MKTEDTTKPVRVDETAARLSPHGKADTTKQVPMATDLVARLRSAPSIDDAVKILSPNDKAKAKVDQVYEIVEGRAEPLPQRRGICVLVYATAARMNKPFKTADIEAALPDKNQKNVAYWTRRLAALGFLKPLAS